ncbi:LysR family transcriptional regulator [Gluconacetobacter dulcium]|uniref:LysR family transcriptional regulator n=1 Tax=Gluconacetobacter dulcium TaxID=2729096 RepID=A0A7W4JYB4_9PROT|nr:LysR family transcriptional regulator [Gluconacetobacter dulcium]MBB2196985.1 LysR family transcriptional regulator [Gluconacetobacter dulcium]
MDDARDLDPQQLRSFLAVAETLHFTSAARRLGIVQSTVSQHVSRLEQAVNRTLLVRSTKQVTLTQDGHMMIALARDILSAQDRALTWFDRSVIRGYIRLGISEDLTMTRLPEILGIFREKYPKVDVHLRVGLSGSLQNDLDTGSVDLLCTKRRIGDARGTTIWREPLTWFGNWEPGTPLPLVVFPEPAITRLIALECLNAAEIPWYVAFTSENLTALLAAVRAGYGVTAQSSFLSQYDRSLPVAEGLPETPEVDFIVIGKTETLEGPVKALADTIAAHSRQITPRITRRRA